MRYLLLLSPVYKYENSEIRDMKLVAQGHTISKCKIRIQTQTVWLQYPCS